MPVKTYRHTVLASTTATATAHTQATPLVGMSLYSAASIMLNVTAASGTTPTLDVRIQKELPDGTTWHTFCAFTQATAVSDEMAEIVAGGNDLQVVDSNDLAAGTILTGMFGDKWAVHYTIGGTNPSFTFAIFADMFV